MPYAHPIGASSAATQRQERGLHTKSSDGFDASKRSSLLFECDHNFVRMNHIEVFAEKLADQIRISTIGA